MPHGESLRGPSPAPRAALEAGLSSCLCTAAWGGAPRPTGAAGRQGPSLLWR